ncbi:MAG: HAD family hydrolase [Phycisphaerales bacterium]
MADSRIKAVIFDMGDTLLNYGKIDPHEPFFKAAKLTWEWLKGQGQVTGFQWLYTLRSMLAIHLRIILSHFTGHDFDSLMVLKNLGRKMGHNLTDEQYEDLVWLWYEPLARLVTIEPDIHQTLTTLRSRGLKLAILSNTFVSASVLNKHLKQLGLFDFFDFIYYSYTFNKRKPHPEMFLAASKQLDIPPHEIIFVGDRIDNDVYGSMQVGMIPVLKKTHINIHKKIPSGVTVVSDLSELPDVIEKFNITG